MSLRGPQGRGNLLVQCRNIDYEMLCIYPNKQKSQCFIYRFTSNSVKRVYEHKNHFDKDSFTSRYNVAKLVYFGKTTDIKAAIEREKQIKGWSKSKKMD